MPKVKYSGHPDGVDLLIGEHDRAVHVKHGHEVEVTATVRDQLVKADPDAWTEVKRDTTTTRPPAGKEG